MELGDGMMSKNVRILVVAVGLVVLGIGSGVSSADPVPVVRDMVAESGSQGPIIHLWATDGLETVHYSPQPGVWIVEMPEATWSDSLAMLSDPAIGIEAAELSHVEEFGKHHSRLLVRLAEPARLDLAATDQGITLRFAFLDLSVSESGAPQAVGVVVEPAPTDLAELPAVVARERVEPAHAEAAVAQSADLTAVEVTRSGEGAVVRLIGGAALQGRSFTLPSPDRLVVDLEGVVNRVERYVYPVHSTLVRQVRVAQHQARPIPVTRLVVDLEGPADFELKSTADGALLYVGSTSGASVANQPPSGSPTITNINAASQVSVVTGEIPVITNIPDSDPSERTADSLDSSIFEFPDNVPVAAEIPGPSQVTAIFEEAVELPERNPWVADPSQLIEEAAAAQEFDVASGSNTYESTEVDTDEVQFTGDPISLTLKDADIKDVLKTFSALTRLNIVIDPEVQGSVTVELRDVPWDQALDLILRINGLDYLLENSVLRVSTVRKLIAEKNERARYLAEQETALPLKTVVKPVSYAKSQDVKSLLSGDSYLMSERGSVVVDDRTNTLIIRDTIDRVEGILRLIETLDQPTPQVLIEGRIVETTRSFSQELGVSWGFSGVMDAEHGNDTGLRFPNSVTADGAVNLQGAGQNALLAFTFADILNTFNLDFLLAAAESQGDAKIVSTPRVTTQNLKTASIRSGLQIPVQTIANNTVTVTYVDATLKLEVTPQITAEGTVNLEIDIRKQQPLQAGQITGGNNAPIQTRDAQTELLVRDGGTTVIGGIYQIDDQQQENRVPGLWRIPVLGHLFRQKANNLRHDELLIFITPRIVKY
ncbi:MAG: type IV pilus secretin PilQ [Thermoanaerobaculales bacterium]|nr:type IV pilus secretin PilQ [Thermoanaerobaculales bacterium]